MTENLKHYTNGTLEEPFVPQEIDDAMRVFPAGIWHLLPPVEAIPREFESSRNTWVDMVSMIFFKGVNKEAEFYSRDGIDAKKAFYHITTILGSWDPTHEQKEASAGYLASLWFEKVVLHGKTYE